MTQYIGKSGQFAVMAELTYRGYNVAMPEIDKGDDIFVVNDASGAMWRVQVKTATGTEQRSSTRYQFRVRQAQIDLAQQPELHFAFVMRKGGRWRIAVISRDVLRNYVRTSNMGTAAGDYRQLYFVLDHASGGIKCSNTDLTIHKGDWNHWPKLI